MITDSQPTGQAENDKLFHISKKDFEQARPALNNIDRLAQTAARAVKTAAVHNILAERLGVPKLEPKVGRHPYRKLFTAIAQGKEELSEDDQNAVIGAREI